MNLHGMKCVLRDKINNKKHKCECNIGRLARNIYFWCYKKDIEISCKKINDLANMLIDFYIEDKSPKHKEFFNFLRNELLKKKQNN